MRQALRIATAPAEEPVTLAEAKLYLRVDVDDDDALITAFVKAARERVELDCEPGPRALVTQTWDLFLDAFPNVIELTRIPVVSVTHVKYYDSAGDQQTLDAADYIVDIVSSPGRIVPAVNTWWPATRARPNAVEVRFVAGSGAAAAVGERYKLAVKLLVAEMYERRSAVATLSADALTQYNALTGRNSWVFA